MSFRATVTCSRVQGEAIGEADDCLVNAVLVADEPDPARPDDWLIHAYFEHAPTPEELEHLSRLGPGRPGKLQRSDRRDGMWRRLPERNHDRIDLHGRRQDCGEQPSEHSLRR